MIRSIEVFIDGRAYEGRYACAGGLLSVEHGGTFCDADVGSLPEQAVAERLLRELVQAKQQR